MLSKRALNKNSIVNEIAKKFESISTNPSYDSNIKLQHNQQESRNSIQDWQNLQFENKLVYPKRTTLIRNKMSYYNSENKSNDEDYETSTQMEQDIISLNNSLNETVQTEPLIYYQVKAEENTEITDQNMILKQEITSLKNEVSELKTQLNQIISDFRRYKSETDLINSNYNIKIKNLRKKLIYLIKLNNEKIGYTTDEESAEERVIKF